MSSRAIGWYFVFSILVAVVLATVGVPSVVLWGYIAVAVGGLALAIRDARAANQAFVRELSDGLARDKAAEFEMHRRFAAQFPWYEEAAAAQQVAMRKGVNPFGPFTTYNPYWTLSYKSLMAHGLTDQSELNDIEGAPDPEANAAGWREPVYRDLLTAGYPDWDAAVRIELYDRHGRQFNVEAAIAQDRGSSEPSRMTTLGPSPELETLLTRASVAMRQDQNGEPWQQADKVIVPVLTTLKGSDLQYLAAEGLAAVCQVRESPDQYPLSKQLTDALRAANWHPSVDVSQITSFVTDPYDAIALACIGFATIAGSRAIRPV